MQGKLFHIDPNDVTLVPASGWERKGGCVGGERWIINFHNQRVGEAYVNVIKRTGIGKYPSLTVSLDELCRGSGVGAVAIRKACAISKYDRLYAHVLVKRKWLIQALTRYGFVLDRESGTSSVVLVYNRPQ
jgi:hypothetical protein